MGLIKLENIDLIYQIKKDIRIKDLITRKKYNHTLSDGRIHALKNLNVTFKDGDRIGIIGHNGAGKSSLLKLIAGIYPPTYGKCIVEGQVATLFELATGFEMEASGWDNIHLRGLMLGETPKTIKAKRPEIAKFSELGEYLNIPVKYYSSGMFMRLAFSISTAIEPEILLLDEVVAAGDAKFLGKAEKRLKDLMGKVKILVFVTHSMDSLKSFCNKAIWLDRGEIKMFGDVEEVSNTYING